MLLHICFCFDIVVSHSDHPLFRLPEIFYVLKNVVDSICKPNSDLDDMSSFTLLGDVSLNKLLIFLKMHVFYFNFK